MQDLKRLNLLIDKAAAIAGSDYKLAQALGIPRQHVSNMRHGKKTATPEDFAILAAAAGLDPREALITAHLDRWEGKPKGEQLRKAFKRPKRRRLAARAR